MGCDRCEAVRCPETIRSPTVLRRLLNALDGARDVFELERGVLTRGDFMDCDLSCRACGARFELRCETYHGAGGTWREV